MVCSPSIFLLSVVFYSISDVASAEPPVEDHSPSSFDLDAILRMFSTDWSSLPQPAQEGNNNNSHDVDPRFELQAYRHEDLLYGFMDGEATALPSSFPGYPYGI